MSLFAKGESTVENWTQQFIEMEHAIASLVGKTCWSFIAGEGSGSFITLAFGEKLRRERPLRNPLLTEEQRCLEGEYELYIECAWRLETDDEVLCTSTSSNHRGSAREANLDRLPGLTVNDAVLRYPGGDIEIRFDNAFRILAFADQANEADEFVNFVFSAKGLTFTNGAKSEIDVRLR